MSEPLGKQGKHAYSTVDRSTELCDELEAARHLRLSVATLRRRRRCRQPPLWVKLGFRIFYRKQDIESFIVANIVRLTDSEAGDAR